jgi:hypothetical protein
MDIDDDGQSSQTNEEILGMVDTEKSLMRKDAEKYSKKLAKRGVVCMQNVVD